MFSVLNRTEAIWCISYYFKRSQKILALSEGSDVCSLSASLLLVAWSKIFVIFPVSVAFPDFLILFSIVLMLEECATPDCLADQEKHYSLSNSSACSQLLASCGRLFAF